MTGVKLSEAAQGEMGDSVFDALDGPFMLMRFVRLLRIFWPAMIIRDTPGLNTAVKGKGDLLEIAAEHEAEAIARRVAGLSEMLAQTQAAFVGDDLSRKACKGGPPWPHSQAGGQCLGPGPRCSERLEG